MQEYEIKNIDDLVEVIGKFPKGQYAWFRGQSRWEWKLLPSIFRNPKEIDETILLQRFRQSAHLLLEKTPQSEFDWLFWMQHYDVPTRLLDWSESPLASLYFAVSNENDDDFDGALWLLDPIKLNRHSNIGEEGGMFIPSFEDEYLLAYLPERLAAERRTNLKPIASLATRNNPRIQAQLGVFTVFHRARDAVENVGDSSHVAKIKIPKEEKENIRNILSMLKVDRFSLFPELSSVGHNIRKELSI